MCWTLYMVTRTSCKDIPKQLNDLMLIFTQGAEEFFDNIREFEESLKEARNELN